MIKIGLTGNIASGKSTVEQIIKDNGFKIIDADFICHELLNKQNIINKVKNIFSNIDILDENNNLSRQKIGETIFTNNYYKIKLEELLHPLIRNEINKFIENNKNENIVFVSIPLLFETKMENMFDKIVLVTCDENIRLQRLIKRNNFTIEYAKARIASQLSETTKINLSDFVINNNCDLESLKINTQNLLKKLKSTPNS